MEDRTIISKESVRPSKEGVLGWLSYIGFSFLFTFPIIASFIPSRVPPSYEGYATRYTFPFYAWWYYDFFWVPLVIGLISILILPWRDFYKFRNRKITFLLRTLPLPVFLCLATIGIVIDSSVYFLILPYSLLFVWYLHYFYKKSKYGYRNVFLKVILFFIIPLLPLLYFHKETYYHESIGPIELTTDDDSIIE